VTSTIYASRVGRRCKDDTPSRESIDMHGISGGAQSYRKAAERVAEFDIADETKKSEDRL
jgi:hypothetical protein